MKKYWNKKNSYPAIRKESRHFSSFEIWLEPNGVLGYCSSTGSSSKIASKLHNMDEVLPKMEFWG